MSANVHATEFTSEFSKTPDWLRLIITSRPDPEVMHPLQGLTPYVLDTSSEENERDLREYLQRELSALAREASVPSAAIDAIIDHSEGVFLYVQWICQKKSQMVGGR